MNVKWEDVIAGYARKDAEIAKLKSDKEHLLNTVTSIKHCLMNENKKEDSVIIDTIWHGHALTLFDFIDIRLEALKQANVND